MVSEEQIRINLEFVREYAANLRRVADLYEQLEKMAQEPDSQLAPILAIVGRMATGGLSQAGELIAAIFPEDQKG